MAIKRVLSIILTAFLFTVTVGCPALSSQRMLSTYTHIINNCDRDIVAYAVRDGLQEKKSIVKGTHEEFFFISFWSSGRDIKNDVMNFSSDSSIVYEIFYGDRQSTKLSVRSVIENMITLEDDTITFNACDSSGKPRK